MTSCPSAPSRLPTSRFRTPRFLASTSLATLLLAPALLAGCSGTKVIPTPNREAGIAAERQQLDNYRMELQLIPPPSKSRYLAIHNLDNWENPYITVQPDMVTLHVLLADSNPTDLNVGGITRPVGARRQDVNVSLDKLAEALRSVPRSSWPYGRVAAVEEAHKVPAAGEPQVRRNMEATIRLLSDLGVVVTEWSETGPR